MITVINQILIFKTNIQTLADKEQIQHCLNNNDAVDQWNIDQQDIDCVLRVISSSVTPEQIISLITNHGFECAELE